jgi:hypothetical protein
MATLGRRLATVIERVDLPDCVEEPAGPIAASRMSGVGASSSLLRVPAKVSSPCFADLHQWRRG